MIAIKAIFTALTIIVPPLIERIGSCFCAKKAPVATTVTSSLRNDIGDHSSEKSEPWNPLTAREISDQEWETFMTRHREFLRNRDESLKQPPIHKKLMNPDQMSLELKDRDDG